MVFSRVNLEDDILSTCIYGANDVNASKMVNYLKEEDFTTNVNKAIYKAVCIAMSEQGAVDMQNLLHYIPDNYHEQFARLEAFRTVQIVDPLMQRLRAVTRSRKMIEHCMRLRDRIDTAQDIEKELTAFESDIMPIFHEGSTLKSGAFIGDILPEFLDRFQKDIEYNRSQGIKTGIPKLDNITGGFREGEQIVIAGRSGMGKSSFMLSCIAQQMVDKKKMAIFSLEMSEDEIIKKLYSIISDRRGACIPYRQLRSPYNIQGIAERLTEVTKYIRESDIYLDTNPRVQINDIRAKCLELKYENKLDIVYIDHIGLMPQNKSTEREELSQITNEGKRMAKELGVPVVLVSQLKRTLDKGGRPTLSDLKGSGTIEEDANTVLFVWREGQINKEVPPEDAKLIMAKARNSETIDIDMVFSTESTMFSEGAYFDTN